MPIKSSIKQDYRLCYDRYGGLTLKHRRRKRTISVSVAGVFVVLALAISLGSLGHFPADIFTDSTPSLKSYAIDLPFGRSDTPSHDLDFIKIHVARRRPIAGAVASVPVNQPSPWQTVSVVAGDNLSLIFGRLGLSKTTLHEIVSMGDATSVLKQIRPGQEISFRIDNGQLVEMIHEIDLESSLHVTHDGDAFTAELLVTEPEKRVATANAMIENSLFIAGQKAGLSDNVIMHLIDIFGWDIDFVLDIRVGDSYSVVYEELFKDGEKVKDGRVLAAEFINQDRHLRAVYFVDEQGEGDYYADNGNSMRKAFLRTPVNFTRISSRFSLQRRHPVLNTIRAHRGVDYAAPHGTPIKATGNGKVVSVGPNGGYGKSIKLQHGGSFSTLYAHMSRFARGLKRGDSVKQGQTIGYVGQTGLATGPHLHYEFLVNGAHRNPLTVELPKAEPIKAEYLAEFRDRTKPLLAHLDTLANQRAAAAMIASSKDDVLPQAASPLRTRSH